MKSIASLLLIFILASSGLFAQSKEDKDKAMDLALQAIDLVDKGRYDEGILLLKKADQLDPKNSTYQYEIAFALYHQEKYEEANKILKSLIKKKDAEATYYQLLGNTYDLIGAPGLALDTYKDGIAKFPKAGTLYLEQGIIYLNQKLYSKALEIFEQGVAAQPTYSSNYFWLASLYQGSDYSIYSAMYAELFLNLERNTKRTRTISELLYDVYKDAVVISDTGVSVSFTKNNVLTTDDLELMKKGGLPFTMQFDMTMAVGVALNKKYFDLEYINRMRTTFVKLWYDGGYDKFHPNPLIAMWKTMIDKGHFEAYNYWVFQMGDTDAQSDWVTEHQEQYDAFVEYFVENPIDISPTNYFSAFGY